VEYDIKGQDLPTDKNEFVGKLQIECDRLIKEGNKVGSDFIQYDSIKDVIGSVPDYVEIGQSLRVVNYEGVQGPCSGTHVKSLNEIEKILIRKVQKKGNIVKISYSC
jgi:Ser-tRNA(Ala) deacylase AlaX